MSSAGAVRAGGAFVEIFANDSKFQQAMTRIQNRVQAVGQTLQRFGTGMSLGGAALGAPMVLAARQAAGFEDAILGMRGAAGLSADVVGKLSDEARRLGKEIGISPTKIAQVFLELTKAGMDVDKVMAGAGRSAVEFSRISGVEASRAAVFMNQAMNVFGTSAKEAVDTLTAAANSSETSIDAMVESFSQVGSTGANFGQSLFDISQAFAVLAKSGIVGEEAGTAIKTMLTKLVAPTQDAEEALGRLGLTIADFRSESGELLSMQQIAGVFEKSLKKLGGNAEDIMMAQKALVDVFEQRGIKVMTAFANAGVAGFQDMGDKMVSALPVSEQFAIAMSGITGQLEKLNQSVEDISIAFGEAISGPLQDTVAVLRTMMEVVSGLIERYPRLAQGAAAVVAGMVAIGTFAITASLAMKAYATASAVAMAMTGPRGWLTLAASLGVLTAALASGVFDPLTESINEAKKAAKELENVGGKNDVKRSQDKKPLDPAIFARRKAAEELAAEDAAFEDAQGKAIERLRELQYNIADQVGDLGEAGFNAAVNFQRDIENAIQQVELGIANPQLAEVLAARAKEVFDADIKRVKDALEEQTRDFGDSMGTFGDAAGLRIGPRIAKMVERAVVNLRGRQDDFRLVAAQGGMAGGGGMAGEPDYGPNPEWLARQAEKARQATAAAASASGAGGVGGGGDTAVLEAIRKQTAIGEEGNSLLKQIRDKAGRGLAFQ